VARVIEVGLTIASVAYGALLGVFLLGVLTRRANERGSMLGMLFGFGVEFYLWMWTEVPWTWYVPIGTLVTFAVGYGTSLLTKTRHDLDSEEAPSKIST
jgi:Na+/proline symporter